MISSILLATVPQLTAEEMIKRIDARAKAGFSADFTLNHNSLGMIKGHFELKQPEHAYLRAQGDGDDYQFMTGPSGAIEIEHKQKQYTEVGRIGRVMFTNSTLSELSFRVVPYALLGSMASVFSSKMSLTLDKSTGIHKLSLNGTDNKADVWVNEAGVVQRYVHEFIDPSGHIKLDFRFSNFGPFHPTMINLEPPAGYRMFVLKRETNPLQPGSKFPSSGWNGKAINGVPTLFVCCSKDCAVTAKLSGMISEIAKSARVVVLSDDGSPKRLSALPSFANSGGSVFNLLNAPGSPTMFAVDGKGVIRQLWFGFNPKETTAVKTAILAALKK
ncbi:MAG: hypothetical protein ABL949_10535 [Fimbriimonadaceae bacterium]